MLTPDQIDHFNTQSDVVVPDILRHCVRTNPSSEMRDWKACVAQWLGARLRLPQTPHIDIHRWTSDAPYCA